MSTPPVLLVHGWGGSFAQTWGTTPLAALLEDAGRVVRGVDLLGHGSAPKPHDPAAYDDLTDRVIDAVGGEPVDAVGFSLGAMTLLRAAIDHPGLFRRLVLSGIGENVLKESDDDGSARIVAALEGTGDPSDVHAQLFRQYADRPGNDLAALAAVMRRPRRPFSIDEVATVGCPTLVVIGDRDFAGPGEPLVAALGATARLVVLKRADHFATPEHFGFIDAVLEFLDADQF